MHAYMHTCIHACMHTCMLVSRYIYACIHTLPRSLSCSHSFSQSARARTRAHALSLTYKLTHTNKQDRESLKRVKAGFEIQGGGVCAEVMLVEDIAFLLKKSEHLRELVQAQQQEKLYRISGCIDTRSYICPSPLYVCVCVCPRPSLCFMRVHLCIVCSTPSD